MVSQKRTYLIWDLLFADGDSLMLGKDLKTGLLRSAATLTTGLYVVRTLIWEDDEFQPADWGTLRVRGPGSWILASDDGQTIIHHPAHEGGAS